MQTILGPTVDESNRVIAKKTKVSVVNKIVIKLPVSL
jgi:hypothetical protein